MSVRGVWLIGLAMAMLSLLSACGRPMGDVRRYLAEVYSPLQAELLAGMERDEAIFGNLSAANSKGIDRAAVRRTRRELAASLRQWSRVQRRLSPRNSPADARQLVEQARRLADRHSEFCRIADQMLGAVSTGRNGVDSAAAGQLLQAAAASRQAILAVNAEVQRLNAAYSLALAQVPMRDTNG